MASGRLTEQMIRREMTCLAYQQMLIDHHDTERDFISGVRYDIGTDREIVWMQYQNQSAEFPLKPTDRGGSLDDLAVKLDGEIWRSFGHKFSYLKYDQQ